MRHTFTEDYAMPIDWDGGSGQVAAQVPAGGGFGGGTLQMEFSLNEGVKWDILESDPASSLTDGGCFEFRSMKTDATHYQLRLSLAGATAPNFLVKIGSIPNKKVN